MTYGLGKGLANLLKETEYVQSSLESRTGDTLLQIDKIIPGKYQPRNKFTDEDLQELSDSIRANGLIQPIIVRRVDQSKYEIIAGERRWRACKMLGLEKIPVVIREMSDKAVFSNIDN